MRHLLAAILLLTFALAMTYGVASVLETAANRDRLAGPSDSEPSSRRLPLGRSLARAGG